MLKKNLTPIYIRKKVSNFRGLEKKIVTQVNHPYPSPQQKWNGQPHTGWGRREFDTLVDVIRQQNGWRVYYGVVFKTKVLHFKIENTPIKDTNGKKKFKRMLIFLFVDKRELFAMKLSFEEFDLVFFTAKKSAWAWFEPTEAGGFWRNLRYILYLRSRKVRLKRELLFL